MGFSSSSSSTIVDPGPWPLIMTLLLCLVFVLLLPLGVAVRQQYHHYRQKKKKKATGENETVACHMDDGDVDDDEDDDDEDDERFYGISGERDEAVQEGLNPNRDCRNTGGFKSHRRAMGLGRLLKKVPCAMGCDCTGGADDVFATNGEEDDDDSLDDDDDDDDDRDLMAQLIDDFEQLNGLEDYDDENDEDEEGNKPQDGGGGSDPACYVRMEGQTLPYAEKYKISLCCGPRPWYTYYLSKGFLRKLWKLASWDSEMKYIVHMAIPYTLHAIAVNVFELGELAVIGQLMANNDADVLGSFLAVDLILRLATMLLDGAIGSLKVLCSHAVGADNYVLAGKYVQLAILLHQAIFFPTMALFWNHMDNIVLFLSFDEVAAVDAEAYGRFALVAVAVKAYDACLHNMLEVCGFDWYSSGMDITRALVSLGGVLAVGMFIEDAQLWMVGAVHVATATLFCLLNVTIVIHKNWLPEFWSGLRSFALKDSRAVKTFIKTSGPLSLGYIVESCEWEILFIFAAVKGSEEVAAWGLLGYIWQLAEQVSVAIADNSEVRVATLLGCGCPAKARYSSHKSLFLGIITSIVMSVIILAFQNQLPTWLTKNETLQRMLSELLPLFCVGLSALTLGSMSWTIICAQGRTRLATMVTFMGSALATLPFAVISTFVLNWNLEGLLASVVLGYALSGIVNSFIMVTSKWEKISGKVVERNAQRKAETEVMKMKRQVKKAVKKAKREAKAARKAAKKLREKVNTNELDNCYSEAREFELVDKKG